MRFKRTAGNSILKGEKIPKQRVTAPDLASTTAGTEIHGQSEEIFKVLLKDIVRFFALLILLKSYITIKEYYMFYRRSPYVQHNYQRDKWLTLALDTGKAQEDGRQS